MKKILCAAMVLLFTNIFAESIGNNEEKIKQVIRNIQTMEIYYKKLPPEEQVKAKEFLNTTILLLQSIQLRDRDGVSSVPSDSDFNRICSEIQQLSIADEERLQFMRATFKYSKLKAEQLAELSKLLTWDKNRVILIKEFNKSIIDRFNISYVINTIDSLSTKNEVTRYLQNN